MNITQCKSIETFNDALLCANLDKQQLASATKYIENMGYELTDNCITDPVSRYHAYSSHRLVMLVIECRMEQIPYA